MSPRLTRPESDRVIAGVAGGIAQRFGFSSTLVRLAWVASVFFRRLRHPGLPPAVGSAAQGPATEPAIGIVEERYARGDISAAELEQMRSDLLATP